MQVKKKIIPTFLPLLESQELELANKSLKEKYLGIGNYVENFEKACSKQINVKPNRVCSVNTGFSAIRLMSVSQLLLPVASANWYSVRRLLPILVLLVNCSAPPYCFLCILDTFFL